MATYGSDASFGASNQGFQLGQNTGTINMNYGRKSERAVRGTTLFVMCAAGGLAASGADETL